MKQLTPDRIAEIKASIKKASKRDLVEVDLNKCFCDPVYQRELDQKHVDEMLANFNYDYIRKPMLSRRKGGSFAIINGQHTIHMLLMLGIVRFTCEVFSGLTVEKEADIFHATNSRFKSMRGWASFKAALAAGHVVEASIRRIVESYGLKLCLNGEPHADFNTPQVLRKIYIKRHQPLFSKMIYILSECFVQGKKDKHLREDAKRNEFQRGLAQFLAANPAVTVKELKTAMLKSGWNAEKIYSEAVTRAGECRRSRSIESFLVVIFHEILELKINEAIRKKAA